jgi:hypothetical protein
MYSKEARHHNMNDLVGRTLKRNGRSMPTRHAYKRIVGLTIDDEEKSESLSR